MRGCPACAAIQLDWPASLQPRCASWPGLILKAVRLSSSASAAAHCRLVHPLSGCFFLHLIAAGNLRGRLLEALISQVPDAASVKTGIWICAAGQSVLQHRPSCRADPDPEAKMACLLSPLSGPSGLYVALIRWISFLWYRL